MWHRHSCLCRAAQPREPRAKPERQSPCAAERRYPNAPLLVAAHYDPVSGNTIIAGHLEAQAEAGVVGENYSLELFASDTVGTGNFPQAQQFLRVVFVNPGDFTVSVPGDLTGQWLTGTISRTRFTAFTDPEGFPPVASHEETSDLGPPLRVSP